MQDPTTDPTAVLAELRPSPPRRVVGVVILGLLGAAMVYLALAYPPSAFGWTLFLLGFGAMSLWLAVRMWQSTTQGLILTRTDLRDHQGTLLASVDQIRAVNRGVFAFKPAGGFTLSLKSSAPRAWAPGLWWRLGRSVGVGGVTHRHEARYMSEVLAEMIRSRT
jgi:hypothetical protein